MWELIQSAGWPIYPLLLASVIGTSLIFERFWALRRSLVIPDQTLENAITLLRQKSTKNAVEVIDQFSEQSALSNILAAALRHRLTQPLANRQSYTQILEEAGRNASLSLERFLNAIGTISAIAPLLGLLGTVIGMIEMFASQAGTYQPQAMAQGISIALYNTAFALVIAIPALVAYRYFKNKVNRYLVEMEGYSSYLLELILLDQQR